MGRFTYPEQSNRPDGQFEVCIAEHRWRRATELGFGLSPYMIRGTGQASSTVVSGSYTGKPPANLVLQSFVFASSVIFPVGLSGSRGTAASAANAVTTFNIQKNGTIVGTMAFAASAGMAIFSMSSATVFTAGDVLAVVAPPTADATLAESSWTLMGFAQ